jgi:hypothetical protein
VTVGLRPIHARVADFAIDPKTGPVSTHERVLWGASGLVSRVRSHVLGAEANF